MASLSESEFQSAAVEFADISRQIHDGWKLIRIHGRGNGSDACGVYLEKVIVGALEVPESGGGGGGGFGYEDEDWGKGFREDKLLKGPKTDETDRVLDTDIALYNPHCHSQSPSTSPSSSPSTPLTQPLYKTTLNILHSTPFQCPVMYFSITTPSGRLLTIDQMIAVGGFEAGVVSQRVCFTILFILMYSRSCGCGWFTWKWY